MKRHARIGIAVFLVVLGVVITANVVGASERGDPGADLAILDRPATEADHLPAAAMTGTVAEVVENQSSVRHLGDYQGHRYYVAPATDDRLCLISYYESSGDTGVLCNPIHHLFSGMWLGELNDAGQQVVVMLAPDGYDAVSSDKRDAVVVNSGVYDNHAFLTVTDDATLRLTGTDKPPVSVEIPAAPTP